jgi:hypothetical protein
VESAKLAHLLERARSLHFAMSSFVIADETRTGSAGPIRENAESIIVRAMDEPAPNAKPSLRVWPKDGADAVDTGELEKPFFFSKMVGVVG